MSHELNLQWQILSPLIVQSNQRLVESAHLSQAVKFQFSEHMAPLHPQDAVYRDSLEDLSTAYRDHFGRHYPAIALFEVTGLFDPDALVELVCVAVVP